MGDLYLGIENEFISFDKDRRRVNFFNYFSKLVGYEDREGSERAMRSTDGLAYYVDGWEIELCTPPVALSKGFASRLTDLVMIGRDRIIKTTPEFRHTGYSMHWNMPLEELNRNLFYDGIAIPFQLFGLNPLSMGMGVRCKSAEHESRRIEVLGDSIVDEKQIRATALMLGAYRSAIKSEKLAIKSSYSHCMGYRPASLNNGRYTSIIARTKLRKILHANIFRDDEMQVQEYMELFYDWIKPFVRVLGTSDEVSDLEDFISGAKPLEFDKRKMFDKIRLYNNYSDGVFWPDKGNKETHDRVLVCTGKERDLPLEGQLLGGLVRDYKTDISRLNWGYVSMKDILSSLPRIPGYQGVLQSISRWSFKKTRDRRNVIADSTTAVYALASEILDLPNPEPSLQEWFKLLRTKPGNVCIDPNVRPQLTYEPDKDDSDVLPARNAAVSGETKLAGDSL